MADRIISAEAIITGRDATGDMFASLAKKMSGIGKNLPTSEKMNDLVKGLQRADAALKSIDKFQAGRNGFAAARENFNAAKIAVTQAAAAMKAGDGAARQLQSNYAAAQRAVVQASAAFERQKAAVLSAKQATEGLGIPIAKIAAEQARLKGVVEAATAAIEHQVAAEHKASLAHAAAAEHQVIADRKAAMAHTAAEHAQEKRAEGIRHHGLMNYAMTMGAAYASAHGIMSGVEYTLEKGAERQHVRVGSLNAGISQDELARMEVAASAARAGAPNLSKTEIIELHKEARSAVQHPEEAFHLIPVLARAASVLKGMGAQDANIADIVKGGESLGLMNDPHRFHAYLEGQIKAMAVMGKTITTEQVYEAAKYSKASGSTLSDEFINLVMPSLIQEMKGSSAGDALSMLNKTFRGGLQHKHLPVLRLNELGLLEDPSQIRRSKTGQIMGYSGKLKGDELLASDPRAWFQQYFKGAAVAHGFKSLADINKLLAEVLPGTAANLGRIMIQQEETLAQHARNYKAAPGLAGAVENQRGDPKAGAMALRSSLDDLASSVSGPSMFTIARGISGLANNIRMLSNIADRHPAGATVAGTVVAGGALAGAGYFSYQLLNGFGLKTSALMLDKSAGLLDEAALKLMAASSGSVPKAATTAATTAAVTGGAAAAAASGAISAGIAGSIVALDVIKQDAKTGNELRSMARGLLGIDDPKEPAPWTPGGAWHNPYGRIDDISFPDTYGDLGRVSFPANVPLPPRRPAKFGSALPYFPPVGPSGDLPTLSMPGPLPGFGGSGFNGQIDITGRLPPVDVNSHIDTDVRARFEITAPAGFSVNQTFQSIVSKPSMGPSMPHAAEGTPNAVR